jgi:hypothetical protein
MATPGGMATGRRSRPGWRAVLEEEAMMENRSLRPWLVVVLVVRIKINRR